jgi:hypothetical protein
VTIFIVLLLLLLLQQLLNPVSHNVALLPHHAVFFASGTAPSVVSAINDQMWEKWCCSRAIALGRLSPAKAADALFTLIRPEFYRPDSQSHLAAQSANICDWVSFRLPAPARRRQKIRGNILTMPANWAENNAVYKLIISINKYKLTAIILN